MTWSLVFLLMLISIFIDQNQKIFFAHVLKKDVLFCGKLSSKISSLKEFAVEESQRYKVQ